METNTPAPEAPQEKRSFAFVAHYVETWNWLLNFRPFAFLHAHPEWRWACYPLYPLCFAMSVWYMIGAKPFNVVDTYDVNGKITGYTILIRNFAWHFLFINGYDRIRARVLSAVLYAQDELKVNVVGLGALTKDETLTQGGKWIITDPRVHVPVVHGDTCTAYFIIKLFERVVRAGNLLRSWIMMIGPTSKIGRAVILRLASLQGIKFRMFTTSVSRFESIRNELEALAPGYSNNLQLCRDLEDGIYSSIWLIGKAKPSAKALAASIPRHAIVINFSVPDPFTPRWVERTGICHLDGGLGRLPDQCGMRFTMRLKPGITYACAIGAMVHAYLGWKEHEVGDIDLHQLDQMAGALEALGCALPPYTSHLKEVSYRELALALRMDS